MRQFLLGKKVAYASGADLSAVADGAIGIFYNKDGVLTACATGEEVTGEAMLVMGRPSDKGGPIVIPIHKNKFSYVKGKYSAATKFSANFTVPAPTTISTYTIIVVKKGIKFNERNKWSADIYVRDTTMTANALAKAIETAINNNIGSGVTATAAAAKVTINANESGVDYVVMGADELRGIEVTTDTNGHPAYGDAKYITDLANKAAADAGFEYTYQDAVTYMYPNYPLNPLAQPDTADTGFTIFTLKFAEPRNTKTTDEVVNQIVQVAMPTGGAGIATFETVCKGLAGIATE